MTRILTAYRALCAACLLALVVALIGGQDLAQARAPRPAVGTAAAFQVYLPLVRNAGTTTPTPPLPPVRVRLDSSRATHASIGPEGGTIRVTAANGARIELAVPPGALAFTEVFTMTPASAVDNLPLSGGLAGAVSLEPAGLLFDEPATLTITPTTPLTQPLAIGFAFDGTGSAFHLRPTLEAAGMRAQANNGTVKMQMPSNRGYGIGSGTENDIARQQAQPAPVDPMDALDQAMLDKFGRMVILRQVYDVVVEPELQRAATNPSAVDTALRHFDQWLRWAAYYDLLPFYQTQIAQAQNLIKAALERAATASADRCYEQKRPEEGFALLRWARYARKYLPGATLSAAIEAKLAKCLRFELTFRSLITETGGAYGYSYEMHAALPLRWSGGGMRATGNGTLALYDGHWTGSNGCTFSMAGTPATFDATTVPFGLGMTPVSRTSPAVNVSFQYDPGTPHELTTMQCPGASFSWDTTAWRTYYTQMHEYERVGQSFRATARIVGAGSFTGWVYHHTTSGPGGQAVVEDTSIDIVHVPER